MTPIHRSRLKVLSLVWFKIYPALFGGQKGIALFNRYLGKYVELDCLCSSNNAAADAGCRIFPELTAGKKQFYSPAGWATIWRWLKSKTYDYIIVEFPYYGLPALLLKQKQTKLIIHTHNIEAERFKSFAKKGWQLLKRYERWCLQKADLVLFKTVADKNYAVNTYGIQPAKTHVLPYGVERVPCIDKPAAKRLIGQKHNILLHEKILLFAGTLDYPPNAEAVRLITENIAPLLQKQLPDFKIIICGRQNVTALPLNRSSNIIYAGFVEDIHPYFAAADCFLDPVRNVHGIQTKIIDALNYGLNVVCFDQAAKDFPAYLSTKLFTATENDFAAFAAAIVPALSTTFDTAEAFYQDFSWEAIVSAFINRLDVSA